MRTLRCKCGKRTLHTSMGSQDCEGCDECNTTFAGHPDTHDELKPHDWIVKYNLNTGEPYNVCRRCMAKEKE